MTFTKQQITLSITKSEMNTILLEAMKDDTAGNSIKRILNPFLAGAFPQFPEHTTITLGATDETGATVATLKQPVKRAQAGNEEDVADNTEETEVEESADEVEESEPTNDFAD